MKYRSREPGGEMCTANCTARYTKQ